MILIPKSAHLLASLVSHDALRHFCGAVHVQELEDPSGGLCFRAEATDGRKLAIIRGPSNLPSVLPESVPDPVALEGLIPAKAFKEAMGLVPKDGKLAVAFGPNEVMMVAGETVFRTALADGRFPPVDAVLPQKPARFSVRVDPKLLIEVLRAAMEVTDFDHPGVQLLFWDADRPIGITAEGYAGLTFDALLMPVA